MQIRTTAPDRIAAITGQQRDQSAWKSGRGTEFDHPATGVSKEPAGASSGNEQPVARMDQARDVRESSGSVLSLVPTSNRTQRALDSYATLQTGREFQPAFNSLAGVDFYA